MHNSLPFSLTKAITIENGLKETEKSTHRSGCGKSVCTEHNIHKKYREANKRATIFLFSFTPSSCLLADSNWNNLLCLISAGIFLLPEHNEWHKINMKYLMNNYMYPECRITANISGQNRRVVFINTLVGVK